MQSDHAAVSVRLVSSRGFDSGPVPTTKGRVLVVDDEAKLVRAFARVLRLAGYDVTSATDGVFAKELLERERFDVIVSDVRMPGMDGFEILRAAERTDPDVPVVLITGSPKPDGTSEAVEAGALLYLVKPVDARTLVQVVSHASHLRRMAKLKRDALDLLARRNPGPGDRAGFEARFTDALAALWIAYQPIVRPSERAVFGYEALMRSSDPVLPDPGSLLDAAERLGRLSDLSRTIRERIAVTIDAAPRDAQIFVNLHPRDLADQELFSPTAPLSRHAGRIVLEITERASLDEIKDLPARMAALRDMGFHLAIDDLGAGYAGLTAFAQIQPEVVKLDMSLVRDVHRDPVKRKIISAMLALCKEMGILVVAEGVEIREEREALTDLGCDLMQGYLFARPARQFPSIAW